MYFRQSCHPRTQAACASPEPKLGFYLLRAPSETGGAALAMLTMSLRHSFSYLSALTLQVLCLAHGTFGPGAQTESTRPPPEEASQHLNTSALNTLLAFEPYQDLASRGSAEQQPNILFSPLGLASAVALLTRVSAPHSRSQALLVQLGLAADSTQQSVEDTVSALTNLLHNLTMPEEEGGGGNVGVGGDGDSGDATEAGSQLRVWSGLQGARSQSDYQTFLSGSHQEGSSVDLESSDKLRLYSYAYFKGRWLLNAHAEEEMLHFSTSVPSNMENHMNLEVSLTLSFTAAHHQGAFRLSGATRCCAASS